ncbi:hypothetical protein CDD82_3598 [Ophiocordyceps australis]|uniref:Succinate dehydrogenase assembly factor 2, mitochondrial n=1 Tax=Ophiocordyceps australis TaxID=1399860 RepID=A0A2C5YGN2_9HYPO|nr:hypothetical protein CDD82_3598 [Ophiocordyceps australis]
MALALRPAYRATRLLTSVPLRCLSSKTSGPPPTKDLDVGELEGALFHIKPLVRVHERSGVKRARLLYQSRKRGTLEAELLFSTFASKYLANLPRAMLEEYDRLLDENDWDLYYWATQPDECPPPNPEAQNPAPAATPTSSSTKPKTTAPQDSFVRETPPVGEWAQTVGNIHRAYRPVPERWRNSHILRLLRAHVKNGSSGCNPGGLGSMPPLGVHHDAPHPDYDSGDYYIRPQTSRDEIRDTAKHERKMKRIKFRKEQRALAREWALENINEDGTSKEVASSREKKRALNLLHREIRAQKWAITNYKVGEPLPHTTNIYEANALKKLVHESKSLKNQEKQNQETTTSPS